MDKVLEIQQQVKNNASDLNDYLRDLDNWTKQMESKDEQLKQAKKLRKSTEGQTSSLKSVVETTGGSKEGSKKCEIKKKPEEAILKPVKTIKTNGTKSGNSKKTRDYSEWDKFDADAACDELTSSTSESEGEAEELELERKRMEAVAEKDRGNSWLQKGIYDKAIEHYTKGMHLDPSNALIPANRAMALLKKYQYGAASEDCTLAIAIDKTYVKAYQRRACARTGLGQYDLAIEDYDMVLKLEPSNKSAINEKIKLTEKIAAVKEVNSEESEPATKKQNDFNKNMKGAFKPKEKSVEEKKTLGSEISTVNKPSHMRSLKPLKRIEIEEVLSRHKPSLVSKTSSSIVSSGLAKKIETQISKDLSKSEAIITIPPIPSTSSKFLTDWKYLKTIVNRSKYLHQFKSSDYARVFKSSLEGSVFSNICDVLHYMVQRGVTPEVVVEQMNGLCDLPRITAVAMFASKQDLNKLKYVLEELDIANPRDREKWIKTFSL